MEPPPTRTHPARPVILRCLMSLCMGLITTWLVAWAFGVWGSTGHGQADRQDFENDTSFAAVTRERGAGVDWFFVMLRTPSAESQRAPNFFRDLAGNELLPGWTRATRLWAAGHPMPDAAPRMGSSTVELAGGWHEAAFGWPRPALRCMTSGRAVLDSLTPPSWFPAQRDGPPLPALPCRPVWSGLVLDTALFAAAWGMLGFGFAVARGLWRVSQGHCPCCGYDLLGIEGVCPECGKGRLPESSPYRSPDASCAARRRRVRLVRAAKLALVLLVVLLIGWGIKLATDRPPDWTPFRENARAVLLRVTDDPAVTSYIVQNFDAAADAAEQYYGEKRSRWRKADLRDYLDSVRIKLILQADGEGRSDVYDILSDWRRVLPD